MRINRVVIENFRSIKSLDFTPSQICALIGENGAGKSNILAALELLLGERWPSSRNLQPSDFFNHDETQSIYIRVEFDPSPTGIRNIWARLSANERDDVRFEGESGYPQRLSSEIRERCALVYVGADRSIERHLSISSWSLLGRIIRQLDACFPKDSIGNLQEHFQRALELLRTNLFSQLEHEVAQAFSEQVRHVNHQLRMEFRAFDPHSYYRSLQLLILEGNDIVSLSEAGQGMRNLAILALFRAYARVFREDAILAVEEPEIYLHPHSQRSLASLFAMLASQGTQIFYTTHSAHFVRLDHFEDICLVDRRTGRARQPCTEVQQVPGTRLAEARQALHPDSSVTLEGMKARYHAICDLEHNEAFFARKVILVEGETEQHALPIYARAYDFDFDVHGVSVVKAGGKTNLDALYQLYTAFGIPVYLVFDNDQGKTNSRDLEWNSVLLRMLGQYETDCPTPLIGKTYAVLDRNFENEMAKAIGESYGPLTAEARNVLGRSAGKGLVARFMALRLVDQARIPPFVAQILDAVRDLTDETTEDEMPF